MMFIVWKDKVFVKAKYLMNLTEILKITFKITNASTKGNKYNAYSDEEIQMIRLYFEMEEQYELIFGEKPNLVEFWESFSEREDIGDWSSFTKAHAIMRQVNTALKNLSA